MKDSVTDSQRQLGLIDIDVLGMARRRWPLVTLGLTVGVAVALLYHFSSTPIYESDIEILVGQRTSELTSTGSATTAQASGDSIQEDQLATHMRLFQSRRILTAAISAYELEQLGSFVKAAGNDRKPVEHILDHLEVRRGGDGAAKDAMVLSATFRDTSPADAATVLEAIYDSYNKYVESHARSTSDEAVELIIEAQRVHEQELADADVEYRDFLSTVPALLDGDSASDIHRDRLIKLEEELNTVRSTLDESRSRLDLIRDFLHSHQDHEIDQIDQLALLSEKEVSRLKLFLEMTRGEVQSEAFQADQPVRQEMAKAQYNRLLELLQTERTLAERFGPGHPLVEATRSQIHVIQRFISSNRPERTVENTRKLNPAEMLKTYTRLLTNDINELNRRESLLETQSKEELESAKRIEGDLLMAESLRNTLERAQLRYDEVSERLQEINLAGAYAGFSTDILSAPQVDTAAAWPHLPIVLAFGHVLGAFFGLILSVTAETFDNTFRDTADLEKSIGASIICHVPRFDLAQLRSKTVLDSLVSEAVPSFHAPRSPEAEIFRIARTGLMIKNRRTGSQITMVTSPNPGDGKSTTISNLAVSFALAGKKVLLIDADMRRPTIANVFGLQSRTGLSDILSGDQTLSDCLQSSEVDGLSIVTEGTHTSEPAELLESAQLAKLLRECRHRFDIILIDAPPILAVADPSIIAPQVDSTLLAVQVRKNGRRVVERASEVLRDMSITPVGIIVNGTDAHASKYYAYASGYKNDAYGYVGYYQQYGVADADNAPKDEGHAIRQPKLASTPQLATRS